MSGLLLSFKTYSWNEKIDDFLQDKKKKDFFLLNRQTFVIIYNPFSFRFSWIIPDLGVVFNKIMRAKSEGKHISDPHDFIFSVGFHWVSKPICPELKAHLCAGSAHLNSQNFKKSVEKDWYPFTIIFQISGQDDGFEFPMSFCHCRCHRNSFGASWDI